MRLTRNLLLLALILVAACGRRDVQRPGTSAFRMPEVTAPRFDDADPVAWTGRSPESYPVHGLDTSRWQGDVNWEKARAAGVGFAFLKATEGGDIVDPSFRENWNAARRAGVPVGAYHFHYHCRPAAEQARWYIRHVPKQAGALPPVLDIEWTPFSPTCRDRPPAATLRAEAAEFMRIVEAHYGRAAIIYTTPDFWEANELWRLPGNHEFWLRSVTAHPSERYEGQRWTFWQYTGSGLVPGIGGRTDINVFAGSEESWAAWLARRAYGGT